LRARGRGLWKEKTEKPSKVSRKEAWGREKVRQANHGGGGGLGWGGGVGVVFGGLGGVLMLENSKNGMWEEKKTPGRVVRLGFLKGTDFSK